MGRIGHCRGFGVQSPWAYRMVRYVINEHYPYYAYTDLRAMFPHIDGDSRRIYELCFRLANSVRPSRVIAFGIDGSAMERYVRSGCRKAGYYTVGGSAGVGALSDVAMALAAPREGFADVLDTFCDSAADGSAAVLLGIGSDKAARRWWRDTVARRPGIVTFDLYYCGLVFIDRKRYKQNYVINF